MAQRVTLSSGELVPAIGQGTWRMGERRSAREAEIAALRLGLDLGLSLIDTAEMYGEGKTEELVGEAIEGLRDRVFLVSKVYPHNAGRKAVQDACDRSLRRLRTDRIDLYLLHWRGTVPLEETVAGFEALQSAGKIRLWGVSNFDTGDMEDLMTAGGRGCAANQILYNPSRRGPEWSLLPWLSERGIPAMAYSPVEQGRLSRKGVLAKIGRRHDASPFQVALAWVVRRPGVIAIPKASDPAHVRENRKAMDLLLDEEDLRAIDSEYEPPARPEPLDMI